MIEAESELKKMQNENNCIKKTSIKKYKKQIYKLNVFTGCVYDCRYCYGKRVFKSFSNHGKSWDDMVIKNDFINRKFRKQGVLFIFPSLHDIPPVKKVEETSLNMIKKILEETENKLMITIKPRLNLVKKIVKQFGKYKNDRILFRFAIPTDDKEILKFWEPKAPKFEDRIDSLKYAFNSKFKTSVAIEPLMSDPFGLIEKIYKYINTNLYIGLMIQIPFAKPKDIKNRKFYDKLRYLYSPFNLVDIYEKIKNQYQIPIELSKSYKTRIKKYANFNL